MESLPSAQVWMVPSSNAGSASAALKNEVNPLLCPEIPRRGPQTSSLVTPASLARYPHGVFLAAVPLASLLPTGTGQVTGVVVAVGVNIGLRRVKAFSG